MEQIAVHDSPDPESLVRQLMEVWETGRTSGLEDFLTEDVVYDDVPNGVRIQGVAGVRQYVGHVHSWAGRVSIELTKVNAGVDSACAEWIFRGVQDRPVRDRIREATHREFALRGVTIIELRGSRIARAADYMDVLGLIVQLGADVDLPGGAVLQITGLEHG